MKTKAIIPIFYILNLDAAVAYYVKVLGFSEAFRDGTYAGMRRDEFEIHLTDPNEPRQIVGAGTAYIICDEVDQYFASIKAAGAKLKSEPSDRTYGMRDFAVFDLDGNQITFGSDNE